jgi:hypothetical protein
MNIGKLSAMLARVEFLGIKDCLLQRFINRD